VTRKTVAAVARLARLPNGLVAAAAVIVGGRWAGAGWASGPVLLAALSAVALTAVANAYNDFEDRAIDAVVHAGRPIPSGAIAPRTALVVALVAGVLGVFLATAARLPLGVLSIFVIAAMIGYGRIKSWSGVAGNALVAILGSLPFLYGAWAAGAPQAAVPLMALAAPLQFAREVAKDIDDTAGDQGRRRTLPLMVGGAAARGIAVAAAVAGLCMLVAIPGGGLLRLAAALLLPAGAFVLFGCWRLLQGQSGAAGAFKAAMVLAILAMVPLAP
jgi:geranylgeranylglycerol-phosphate geranylgeranyltransferase